MQSSISHARQRQMRGFVIAWLGVTLLMGALTFVGIYYATGIVNADNTDPDAADNVAALSNAEANATVADDAALSSSGTTSLPADGEPVTGDPSGNDQPAGEQSASGQSQGAQPPVEPAPEQPVEVVAEANPAAADTGDPNLTGAASADQPDTTTAREPAPAPAAQEVTATPVPVEDQRFQLGVQVRPNFDPEVYKLWVGEVRDKLRLGWIKQQVRWKEVEPQPGQYNWAELDVALQLASESNIKVMLSVVTTPDWAREPGNQRLDEVGPPGNPQDFANFLITMLYRYPNQIHAIEIWNEMNIDREWASIYGLSAENYVTLLQTAHDAIKMVDPGIIVISGALSPTGWNDGVAAYDDFVYMDMLIQAGMLDTVDCVGAHHNGYNIGPNVPWNNVPNDPTATFRGPFDNPHHSWSFYSTLHGYAQRIQQAGSDIKLCVTEFGWASSEGLTGYPTGFEFANDNTLAEQAQFFDEAIQSMESWGFVWLAWIWNLNYGPPDWNATDDNVPYSLLRPEWTPAPAYDIIAKYDFRSR